jgi:hypothetical protein
MQLFYTPNIDKRQNFWQSRNTTKKVLRKKDTDVLFVTGEGYLFETEITFW